MLTAILITWLGYQFGKARGWWGEMKSGGSSSGSRGGGGFSGSSPGVRSSGPSTSGSRGSGAVRGIGSRIGRALGWREAKRIHDRSLPPVTWGEAWREGIDAGKERGRERYAEGQQRKLEREQQRQWLAQAEERSGEVAYGPAGPGMRKLYRHIERSRTCPDCGHGNYLNDSRASCSCARDDCACGTDAAPIGPDDDADRPDLSLPLDDKDEPQWGPPGEVDEVAEKRRERDEESASPQQYEYTPADEAYINGTSTPAPTGDGNQTDSEENPMTTVLPAPSSNVAGEVVNIDSAVTELNAVGADMAGVAERMTEVKAEARRVLARCDALTDGMSELDMGPQDLAAVASLRESAQQALADAEKAEGGCMEAAGQAKSAVDGINTRHGAIKEAVQSSPHAARIDAYKAS